MWQQLRPAALAYLVAVACLAGLPRQAVAAPTFQAAGTAVGGTGAVNVPWPAHAIDDIALLFVESTGGEPATLATPAGFAAVPDSPQFTGAGTAGTRLTVFWARATSAAMATPRVADAGNHVYARILTYRGAVTSGNPWDVTGGGFRSASSVSVSGVTTTASRTRIVQIVTRDNDSTAAAFSAQTNPSLTGITEQSDAGTTSGNGGGFALWDGVKNAPGATGNTTAAIAVTAENAFLTVALKPQPGPRFQAAGTAVSGTGNVSPAWPAHAIGDVALLFVESSGGQAATLSVPAGFVEVPGSPQATGAGIAGTRLTVFWARASSAAMTAPTVTDPGNHVYARILTYRGVISAGNPWDVTAGYTKAVASTAVSMAGVTTTVADTLVVQAVSRDNDSSAAAFSLQANPSLTGIAERSDAGTASANGGGIGIWDGYKATAGATGNTTAAVTNSVNGGLTIALRPTAITAPTFQAAGTARNGTGSVSPPWPAHAVGDVALLVVESAGGQPITLSVPNGFAELPNSPQFIGAGTAGTRLAVFWARATSAAMPAPTVADPGDHVYARIFTYRGVIGSGNPWDVTGGGVRSLSTVAVTGVTTTVADTRIVQAVTRDNDSAAAAFSAQTNANLAGIAERTDAGSTSGNGGGFAVWDGVMTPIGATGDTTAAVAVLSTNAFLSIALKGPPIGLDHVELIHDGSALTCTPKAVTVLGCISGASCYGVPANQYAAGTFPISLTAIAGATWCSDSLCATALPNPATVSTGDIIYLRDPNVRTDRMGGTATTAGNTTLQCSNTATGTATNATTECDVAFADAGFIFDVPTHRAEDSQAVTVSAVRKSDSSPSCIPAFAGVNKTVNFKCTYSDPASGSLPVRVGGVALNAANSTAASCDVVGGNVTLAFNAGGVATTSVIYADAGSMGLSASYTGSGADAGLAMTGSDAFIAVPNSFGVSTTGPFVAGTAFGATVTARNAAGNATPNFGQEATAATVMLASSNPDPGPGNATAISTAASGFTAGVSTTNVTWNEVGTIDLAASSSNYLGSGLNIAGSAAAVGPFRPGYFDTIVTPGCSGAFTYAGLTGTLAGQPFTVEVKAKRSGGDLTNATNTANYAGATWAKAVTLTDAAAGSGTLTNGSFAATDFSAGIASRADVSYAFAAKLTAPYALAMRATDTDGVSSSGHAEGSTAMRSGRLRLSNAFGSERMALQMPVQAHFWSGSSWVLNAADSCTSLLASAFYLAPGAPATSVSAVAIAGGNGTLALAAPGAGNTGSRDIAANLGAAGVDQSCLADHGGTAANLPWLRSQNGSCAATFDRDPSARATFGIYSPETRRTIHIREQF